MNHFSKGFTIVELIVVVAILALLSTIVLTNFPVMKKRTDLNNTVQEIMATFRLAQVKAMSSENNSRYGVYFNNSVSPVKYTIFKGSSYASRDTSADQNFYFPKSVQIFSITMTPTGNEVVYEKYSGTPVKYGGMVLWSKAINRGDVNVFKSLFISTAGIIDTEATNGDADRIKDSRHIIFNYTRVIDTSNESISLNYNNGTVVHSFPISAYLTSGQLDITDTVTVGGTSQTVRVRTYLLNGSGPKTQFGVYRDKRLNDKSLTITISGDNSGNLLQYSADGVTTTSSSIYVSPAISNSNWQ